MIDWTVIIGLVASVLITVAYIPEVIKTVKSRHTRDLSLSWLVTLVLAQLLYLVYAVEISSLPVMISSGAGSVMMTIMLACKLSYKNR